MTAQTLRLCLMNLLLRDLSFDIKLKLGNSLLDDKFPELKADFIIANPPFNVSNWHPKDLPDGEHNKLPEVSIACLDIKGFESLSPRIRTLRVPQCL